MELSAADRWIISRLQEVAAEVETAFGNYRFDLAAQAIYSFVWHEYCDWYLELSKVVLTDAHSRPEQSRGTRRTLVQVLETALRLLHPIMPFITEEVWQRIAPLAGKQGATIMREPYPRSEQNRIDVAAIDEMRWVMAVISAIRTIRSERDITPGKTLPVLLQDGGTGEYAWMQQNNHYLLQLARVKSLDWLAAGKAAPESVMQLVGKMKVLVPLGSLIDKQTELNRISREIEKIETDLSKAKAKLANPDFTARAPKNVVEQEENRVKQFEVALANLHAQHAKVGDLPG